MPSPRSLSKMVVLSALVLIFSFTAFDVVAIVVEVAVEVAVVAGIGRRYVLVHRDRERGLAHTQRRDREQQRLDHADHTALLAHTHVVAVAVVVGVVGVVVALRESDEDIQDEEDKLPHQFSWQATRSSPIRLSSLSSPPLVLVLALVLVAMAMGRLAFALLLLSFIIIITVIFFIIIIIIIIFIFFFSLLCSRASHEAVTPGSEQPELVKQDRTKHANLVRRKPPHRVCRRVVRDEE